MRVDPGAHGGPTHRQFGQPLQRGLDALAAQRNLASITPKLLLQRDGHGVHQVRAPRLGDMRILAALRDKCFLQSLHRGQQLLTGFRVCRNA